jgi:hypothetical protein
MSARKGKAQRNVNLGDPRVQLVIERNMKPKAKPAPFPEPGRGFRPGDIVALQHDILGQTMTVLVAYECGRHVRCGHWHDGMIREIDLPVAALKTWTDIPF